MALVTLATLRGADAGSVLPPWVVPVRAVDGVLQGDVEDLEATPGSA
jgi:hypothetical protein